MPRATRPVWKRIAIVFDFDETLAPGSYDTFLESCGLDPEAFRRARIDPLLREDWDEILAKCYALIEESRGRRAGDKITRDRLAAFARGLEPFGGVREMFDRLRTHVWELDPEIEVEFYLVSSGLGEIARNTDIAQNFKAMWGCEYHYDEAGEVAFPKQVLSHSEKTRYLAYITQGIDDSAKPPEVVHPADPEHLHVPFTQMIYVGDGSSDIPCFTLLNQERGTAIGVAKPHQTEEWGDGTVASDGQRVANVAPAGYAEDSELLRSLILAVEAICKRIALARLSVGE